MAKERMEHVGSEGVAEDRDDLTMEDVEARARGMGVTGIRPQQFTPAETMGHLDVVQGIIDKRKQRVLAAEGFVNGPVTLHGADGSDDVGNE